MPISHRWLDYQKSIILRDYTGTVGFNEHMSEMAVYQSATTDLSYPFDLIVDLSKIENLDIRYSGLLTSVMEALRQEKHQERLTIVVGANRYFARILSVADSAMSIYTKQRRVVSKETREEALSHLEELRRVSKEPLSLLPADQQPLITPDTV